VFTLKELVALSEAGRIEIGLRVKEDEELPSAFTRVQERFEQRLNSMLMEGRPIERIYICGPPVMNHSISQTLDRLSFANYTLL
jgi:NAD(P)H-flavin reductase